MIIKYPTGLYKSVLPVNGASGNITYTISSTPPRPTINTIKLPIAEEFRTTSDKIFTYEERREQLGELVFTVISSNESLPGSNIKAFEIGEVLLFENLVSVEEINVTKAPNNVEIRHNTNILDLESVGLNPNEIEEVIKLSQQKHSELELAFAKKRTEIENIDINIRENQKQINEVNKTIKAIGELFNASNEQSSNNEIILKLNEKHETLKINRDDLISMRNQTAIEIENTYKSLINVSELVR